MKTSDTFFRHNLACQDSLDKMRSLLLHSFGIDDFWHITLYENGQLANVSTYYEQWINFWDKEHYKAINFLIAPSRLKESCFHLSFDKEFVSMTDSFKDTFPQYHPFIMIRKEQRDIAHIYGFAARKYMPNLESFYINNLPILDSFLNYYATTNPKFTKHTDEQMVNIAELRGSDNFYKRSYGNDCHAEREQFLKALGVDAHLFTQAHTLSNRERQVLAGAFEGKTAAQHGKELGLSSRTIQFYIDNAKNKLGVLSREELFEKLYVLKIAGFFDV